MKFTLSAILALAAGALAATDAQNWAACAKFSPEITQAIVKFCHDGNPHNNLRAPSPYAQQGVTVGHHFVEIQATCSPAQWVPHKYCGPQFREICANSLYSGLANARFGAGANKCQLFIIGLTGR